jgi:hypothetical protein
MIVNKLFFGISLGKKLCVFSAFFVAGMFFTGCNGGRAVSENEPARDNGGIVDDETWEQRLVKAQIMVEQGGYKEAKERFEAIIKSNVSRSIDGRAKIGRADCNYGLGKYSLASRQYHWVEQFYRDVPDVKQDEVMYKLGMACKKAEAIDLADYWFGQVIEFYATGAYAEKARVEHSGLALTGNVETPYTVEVGSFTTEKKAREFADKLEADGYEQVAVVPTTAMGFSYWDVHVGRYRTKLEAKQKENEMIVAGLGAAVRPAAIRLFK